MAKNERVDSTVDQIKTDQISNLSLSSEGEEDEEESHFDISPYINKGQRAYEVCNYHENCDEDNQISYILPLFSPNPKYYLFIMINICTLGIINFFLEWFPKLILYIKYEVVDLKTATHFGIFSKDGKEFEVVEKNELDLPQIDYNNENSIIKKFNLNIEPGTDKLITFEYNYFKYLYSTMKDNFEAISYHILTTQKNIVENFSKGLNTKEVLYMQKIFGECDIDIDIVSCGQIIFDELSDPYYLFLLYSLILWICLGSYIYSLIILALEAITFFLGVRETYVNLKKIQELSRYSCPVNVYRRNENSDIPEKTEINSTELVPGDVFEIPSDGLELPCDTILIKGDIILKESQLTGDSLPVIKEAMEPTEKIFNTNHQDIEEYIGFAGSKIIHSRKIGNSEAKGIVFRTGFETVKGDLIANILNSEEDDENFTNDSIKFIIIMGILTIVSFCISLKFLIDEGEYTAYDLFIYFLDLITNTINPCLPTCLSIGITYNLARLKTQGFFSTKRYKINKAGMVNMFIFDKTGTLTEDYLDIKGFIYTFINKEKQFEFNSFIEKCDKESDIIIEHFNNRSQYKNWNKDLLQYYIECLSCCHSLINLEGKLIGDPIDIKMFESLGWTLEENTDNNNTNNDNSLVLNYIIPNKGQKNKIAVMKRFNLDKNSQRITVITKKECDNFFKVFCKGSPENIRNICDKTTIPKNFDETLDVYTNKGYRVLALAAKSIITNLQQIQILTREQVETNLIFLGFLIIENKLKAETKDSIEKFDRADLGMIVVTGDNLRTAICVARECNLITKEQEMVTCEIEYLDKNIRFKWTKLENELNNNNNSLINNSEINNNNNIHIFDIMENTPNSLYELYPPENINITYENNNNKIPTKLTYQSSLKKQQPFIGSFLSKSFRTLLRKDKRYLIPEILESENNFPFYLCKDDSFGIAITGNTLEYLYKLNQKYIKHKIHSLKIVHEIYRLILSKGKVFARMIPENKALLIKELNNEGFTTLMCGDGSNDCLALRAADVSVSLSPETVSFAGDFNSKNRNISCVYSLLREGKCSLITSMATFKYMMIYSVIQSLTVILVSIYVSEVNDYQALLTDLFLIFPMELFLSMTKPYEKLTHHYPIIKLLSFPIIISILIHTLLVFAFQFGGYKILKNHYNWENICDFDEDDEPLPCHENTVLFLISIFQYTGSAVAFFVSKPFRQRIYTNWVLMIYLAGIYFYSIWITINCDSWSKDLFNLHDLEKKNVENKGNNEVIKGGDKIKYYILIIAIVNTFVSIFFEWIIMKFVRKIYENRKIKNYKIKIDREKNMKENKEKRKEIDEVNLYKYNRVYFYDRRIQKKSQNEK